MTMNNTDKVFEITSTETWKEREEWIDSTIEELEVGSYLVSEHSTALFFDMRRAYCAGAWISVVVMAISVMDSHFRETESGDNKINTAKLLKEFYGGEDVEWLRKLRNRYVHHNLNAPFLEMDTWFNDYNQLEADARKAMMITIKSFFLNPGT
jgi:hypothetical protein